MGFDVLADTRKEHKLVNSLPPTWYYHYLWKSLDHCAWKNIHHHCPYYLFQIRKVSTVSTTTQYCSWTEHMLTEIYQIKEEECFVTQSQSPWADLVVPAPLSEQSTTRCAVSSERLFWCSWCRHKQGLGPCPWAGQASLAAPTLQLCHQSSGFGITNGGKVVHLSEPQWSADL